MKHARLASVIALAVSLPACATIVEGTTQDVSIDASPQGAVCRMSNNRDPLGVTVISPGTAHVGKSRSDLVVTCSKPGYATRMVAYKSAFVGTTFGNLLIGGAAGFLTDASTGANFVYPNEVLMYLPPITAAPFPLAYAPEAPAS